MAKLSLSESAYKSILSNIVNCTYAPGSVLTEERLVAELGHSRTPIRSALVRLQEEQLVHIMPKKGIVVTKITLESIRDLFNLRDMIEPPVLREFGSRFKKEDLMQYYSLFSPDGSRRDATEIYDSDARLHTHIVTLSENQILISFYNSLQNRMTRINTLCAISTGSRLEQSNREHADIIYALLKDDSEQAARLLTAHLKEARESAYQAVLLRGAE